jgi:hypothetical protein
MSCLVEGIRVFFVNPHNGFFATSSVYGRWGCDAGTSVHDRLYSPSTT